MKKRNLLVSFLLVVLFALNAFADRNTHSNTATDPTLVGPHPIASAEYKFAAETDPEVLDDRMTEVWGKLYYPTDSSASTPKAPLIIMLHGNHGTCGAGSHPRLDMNCEYTDSGTCPIGYVPTPNHAGYDYLAENLASWGYYVASINANRGITCGGGTADDDGLNLARGRLVLKHLSLFYQWATIGGAPASLGIGQAGLLGKLDFASVGLFGHSRGGEGVRAAYNLYLDSGSHWPAKIPGLKVKAIYEIGAVDGQTSRVLDANGTVWNQLLPMCDGDVSRLDGRFPFERMLQYSAETPDAQKSLYEVWGANHNFFNSEWQSSDAQSCLMGTPLFDANGIASYQQQFIALTSVSAFFRSHLGDQMDEKLNQQFNPLNQLPTSLTAITQIDRDFTTSPGATEVQIIDDFEQDTGTSSSGLKNSANQIEVKHRLLDANRTQRVAELSWAVASKDTYFAINWADQKQGRDIQPYYSLDFRVARIDDPANTTALTDFSLALEDVTGVLSKEINISDFAYLNGPGNYNPILRTIRIPLALFQGVDSKRIRSVRFIFDKSQSGAILLANVRLHKQMGLGGVASTELLQPHTKIRPSMRQTQAVTIVPESLNSIRSIRFVNKSFALSKKSGVEIRLASTVAFPVLDSLPILKIGQEKITLSRYSDTKSLKEITFTLTEAQYKRLADHAKVSVTNGKIWNFMPLKK